MTAVLTSAESAAGCTRTCAGRDFTHRQTVKRKAQSWGWRYRAMPPAERLAVLAAIMAAEAQAPP